MKFFAKNGDSNWLLCQFSFQYLTGGGGQKKITWTYIGDVFVCEIAYVPLGAPVIKIRIH